MNRRVALLAALGSLAGAAPAQAEVRDLLDTSLAVSASEARACIDRRLPAGAAGAATRALDVPADGLLSVELTAASGDWDVAAFDRGTGERVAGAAGFDGDELAQGFVRRGQDVVVQACRRSGTASTADLRATLAPVDLSGPAPTMSLVEVETPRREDVERLSTLGLDLTEHGEDGHRGAVLAGAQDERRLRGASLSWRTVVPDLAAASRAHRAADRRFAAAKDGSALPSGREGYRRLADFEQEMKDLAAAHPSLVRGLTLPLQSLEGRDVHGIEITPDVHRQDGKPVFLLTGVHHAREWPSAENPFEFAIELVKGYGLDARITRLLDRTRVIVVPVVNVDGYNLSREAPDEGTLYEYKRKNCRTSDDMQVAGACALAPDASGIGVGVDPNRNWGGDWGGPGAATDPVSATYRGAGPFSEPEVENVRRLISTRQVTTFITNHTYGSLVLRPPGIAAYGPSKDERLLAELGEEMSGHNGYTNQFSWQLYDTSGTAEAWSYYATGGLGYTFEIHAGNFHREYADAVVEEYLGTTNRGGATGNRGAYFAALESTADAGRHAVITGQAPPGSTLTISKTFPNPTARVQPAAPVLPWGPERVFTDTLTSTYEVPADGRVEWHVNPSTRPDVAGGRLPTGPTTQDVAFTAASTVEREISVAPGEDNGRVRVRLDGGTSAEDWTLDLFKWVDGDLERQARSNVANRPWEELSSDHAGPGTYVVRATAVRARTPATVAVDFQAPEPPEAWTLTCAGSAGTLQVVVDRGETRPLGRLCD